MPPRKPIAESAKHSARRQADERWPDAADHASRLGRHDHDACGGDDDCDHHRPGQRVAEKDQTEHRDLNRLGLGVGDGDDE